MSDKRSSNDSETSSSLRVEQAQGLVVGDHANVVQNFYVEQATADLPPSDLTKHHENALAHATRYIEGKSQALKPAGTLPQITSLMVTAHTRGVHHRYDDAGNLLKDSRSNVLMTLFDAVKLSRHTVLLGDMGSGKSTLAGKFIKRACEEQEDVFAFIIPAKHLKFNPSFTLKELLRAISTYFNDQISPTTPPIMLEEILNRGMGAEFAVDGIDEIPLSHRAPLLNQLRLLTHSWANAQVLVTGRPVELIGVSFEDWQVLTPAPLKEEDRNSMFIKEAISEGFSEQQAKEVALRLERKLSRLPNLRSLATSPLVVRLLYSQLLAMHESKSLTLGDLLYELVRERMSRWSKRDSKQSIAPRFEAQYPDEHSRMRLLGQLALDKELHKRSMTIDAVLFRLTESIRASHASNAEVLVHEALQFFEHAGLVTVGEEVEFAIKPFLDVLCGYGLAIGWQRGELKNSDVPTSEWRMVSFAATVMRKLGFMETSRSHLLDIIKNLLLTEPSASAAASYIVSESQDTVCATELVEELKKLGPRPLAFFKEEKLQSARAIAESLKLAGEAGFQWMFDEYLDPRFPIINWLSRTIELLFEQWAYLSIDSIKDNERTRLKSLIVPHIAADTHQLIDIIPLLAMLIPEEFEPRPRLWFTAKFLDDDVFAQRAEERLEAAFKSEHQKLVNAVLIKHAQIGYENATHAARLWLRLNPEGAPHTEIAKALVHAYGDRARPYQKTREGIVECTERIGEAEWLSLLKLWLEDKNSHLQAGTAMCLYELGAEGCQGLQGLHNIGTALMKALHDGGYVRRAEEILAEMIQACGDAGVEWLAERIATEKYSLGGAHSGYWRLLLSSLTELGARGPDLLSKTVKTLDYDTLPRYPEVRQLFRNLLTGKMSEVYRKMLRALLHDENPTAQNGAAMILVTSDPEDEAEALEAIVRVKPNKNALTRHEWLRFCLTLTFSSSVLTHLKTKLSSFTEGEAIFALAILYRNQVSIEPEQYERLVQGLTLWWNYGLDLDDPKLAVVAQPTAYAALVKAVEDRADKLAASAADRLLRHHADSLSPSFLAKCVCLAVEERGAWGLILLREQMQRIEREPAYSSLIEEAAKKITAQGGKRPLLDLVREAVTDLTAWKAVVLRMLNDDENFGMEVEEKGQWLLDCGRLAPQYKQSIGEAAHQLFDELKLNRPFRGEALQWLAIVADEFIGLTGMEIENALLSPMTIIRESATSALIARAGRVPGEFKIRGIPVPSLEEIE
jgi:hypothetical protein